jgi:tyrosyl-tRNA synthetase
VLDPAEGMFGKLMSISDALMWKYWTLLTDRTPAEIDGVRRAVAAGERHPMDVKFELARVVTADFHDADAAAAAEAHFRNLHQRREVPDEVAEVALPPEPAPVQLARLLVRAGLAESNSEARRLMQGGGVKVDGEAVRDPKATVPAEPGRSLLLQAGKRRFARVVFRS